MTTTFRTFPTVTLPDTSADEIGFFEAIAITGLEKQYVRIPVATQRKHFGYAPFGKLAVRVENGVCRTIKCMDYGKDYDYAEAFWSMTDKTWRSSFDCSLLAFFPKI
jgi:hypothetical protein